jgi:ABC-type multidrug transport system ATPase subunit
MIVASELRLALDGRTILEGIDFRIARGESVALVGPNGSGKTSILRCILGLVPFTGRITVGGHDVVREPVAARTLCAYVPQKPAFGDVRAIDALTFVARLRRIDAGRITAALRAVDLEPYARLSVRRFSGGMQQRLSLAAALLVDAPVLLFDEPTANLDRDAQATFLDMVARLRDEGRTLVLASHRPEEVERLTERVLHVDRGRITPDGVSHPALTVPPGRVIRLAVRAVTR